MLVTEGTVQFAPAALRISGRIPSDSIESFVEVLETPFDVVADRRPDGEIVLHPVARQQPVGLGG